MDRVKFAAPSRVALQCEIGNGFIRVAWFVCSLKGSADRDPFWPVAIEALNRVQLD